MKHFNKFLMGVIFVFSSLAFAQEQGATNDLAARLQAEIATFKNDIATQRGDRLIDTADLLTGAGLSDAQLYSVVEAKTKELIAEHEAKPRDKIVAEELNAMIRALGSMNPASKDIIVNLVESSSSRGIRNRAHRLHPKLSWFAHRNMIMQKTDFYLPGQDLMAHRYINLLVDADYNYGRWAMEELDRRGGAEPVVYRKMAEILEQQKENIKSPAHLDYLAWITKILARYDSANSAELLKSIKNDPRKDKFFQKLKKYAKV